MHCINKTHNDLLIETCRGHVAATMRGCLLHVEELQQTVAELRFQVQQQLGNITSIAGRVDQYLNLHNRKIFFILLLTLSSCSIREDRETSRHANASSTLFDL